MFQLCYKMPDIEAFTHQITQMGARFISKGPEIETYYASPQYQLKIEEGKNCQLILLKQCEYYQELQEINLASVPEFKDLFSKLFEERCHLTKQVIRYYLRDILIEIHRFEKIPTIVYLRGETLNSCLDLSRRLNISTHHRLTKTPGDIATYA